MIKIHGTMLRNHFVLMLATLLSLNLPAQEQFDASFVRYSGLRYTCDGVFTPVVTIKNVGSTAMNSCVVDTWKNGLQVGSFNWILAVAALPDESRRPALPAVADVQAGDILEFRIISVNEQVDQGAADNILELEVEDTPPLATSYLVRVTLPAAGASGTSWRVIDRIGQTVALGGPYTGSTEVEAWVTLEAEGCYALEISGDDVCEARLFSNEEEVVSVSCEGGPGTYAAGFLSGSILAVQDPVYTIEMALYPNPTNGPLSIGPIEGSGPPSRIMVLDASGRELMAHDVVANNGPTMLDLSSLPNGAYMLRSVAISGAVYQARVLLLR